MRLILHISADFPDGLVPNKTNAVHALVESQHDQRHLVYSLNRVTGLRRIEAAPFGEDRIAVAYEAPPNGLLHHTRLRAVARWIIADLERQGVRPDAVHCHKLTVEGLIGLELKAHFDCPMIVTIQGDTDTKILRARLDLTGAFRRVLDQSQVITSVSRWPLAPLRQALGPAVDRCVVLPAITQIDTPSPAQAFGQPRLVSAFHLSSWRRKGADVLARAATIAARTYPELTVDVFGGGPPRELVALKRVLEQHDPAGRVRLVGPVDRYELALRLKTYAGFVMPSRRETYGMAYVEALLSGLPLAYSRGRGVDEMAPPGVGYAFDPLDAADVAAGMVQLIANEGKLKRAVAEAQASGALDLLLNERIAASYAALLSELIP